MAKFLDLTGKIFGNIKVIKRTSNTKYGTARWLCICGHCGKECIKTSSSLISRSSDSCGCMKQKFHNDKIKKHNTFNINDDNTVSVKFSNSDKYFICDLEDWNKAKEYNWALHHTGYAYTTIKSKYITFHDFINKEKNKINHIDHIERTRLNNCRKNLRGATRSQNMMNRNTFKNNTSGHTGVHYNKNSNKWVARISVDGKRISLGTYELIEDAIKVRKEAEIKYFGEFRPIK